VLNLILFSWRHSTKENTLMAGCSIDINMRIAEVVTACIKHSAACAVLVLLKCNLTSVAEIHLLTQAHVALCPMVFMSPWMNARCRFDSTWVVNEPLGSIKCGFCSTAGELLACQEGVYSIYLVSLLDCSYLVDWLAQIKKLYTPVCWAQTL